MNKGCHILPLEAKARKAAPMARGCLDYFPLALAYVAEVSRIAGEQHHPGKPIHWERGKSTDHADCLLRHLVDRGRLDPTDGLRHSGKVAWRALALLQTELELAMGIDAERDALEVAGEAAINSAKALGKRTTAPREWSHKS